MTDQLAALHVVFAQPPAWLSRPDARGTAHQPWAVPPWNLLPRAPRAFPPGLSIGQSLVDRLAAGPVLAASGLPASVYAPANLTGYIAGAGLLQGIPVA